MDHQGPKGDIPPLVLQGEVDTVALGPSAANLPAKEEGVLAEEAVLAAEFSGAFFHFL